jgi:hypothetical protein
MTSFSTRVTFDHLRNSAAGFASANPVLGYGVTGLETDTGRIKVGDGTTPWNSLVYSTGSGVLSINSLTAQDMTIVGGDGVTVSSSGSEITIDSAGAVLSVAGRTGVVTLTTADITDFSAEDYGKVSSVNGQTGTVNLSAASVSAASAVHSHVVTDITDFAAGVSASQSVSSVNGQTGTVNLSAASVSAASAVHSHVVTDITDFAAGVSASQSVSSVNGQTGTVVLVTVASLNNLTGTLTIAAGEGVTITTSAGTLTIAGNTEAGGGGGGGGDPTTANVSTVTSTQDNWDIGTADISFIYSGITNTINVTGLATASSTLPRLVINGSTHTAASFTIKHDNSNSTAALRILVPWAGDYVVSPNGGAALVVYDNNQTRWRVV